MRDDPELDPDSSIAYIALSILCSSQNSLIPEILYLFSPKQIVNFIKVFSGETIKVPTVDEFHRIILTSLACYHVLVQERSWDWFALTYGLDGNKLNGIHTRLENWILSLSDGEREFIDKLKAHELATTDLNIKADELLHKLYK